MKKALITGVTGQDGCYLSKLLLEKGYKVYGSSYRFDENNFWRLKAEGHYSALEIIELDLQKESQISEVVQTLKPDEIYNLGAQSLVGRSSSDPSYTTRVNSLGTLSLLEAIKNFSPATRFYQASSSEIFGNTMESPQNEETCFQPRNPYGVSKQYAHWITKVYRINFGLHASCGILYNHESPYRGCDFISGKVAKGFALIRLGLLDKIEVGNIEATRDWGFSGDYVKAMYLMLQQPNGGDFIIGTGQQKSVKDLINAAAKAAGISISWEGSGLNSKAVNKLNGQTVVTVNPSFYRANEQSNLVADNSKAKKILGWRPEMDFETLIGSMVLFELKKASLNIDRRNDPVPHSEITK